MPLDLLDHPEGRHGFDILDDDDRSREIVGRTFDFLRRRLVLDRQTGWRLSDAVA